MKILRIRGSDDLKLPLLFGSDQDDDTRDIRMVFLQLRETGVQHLGIIEGILDERPEYSLREKCLRLQEAVDRSLEFPQKIVGIEKNDSGDGNDQYERIQDEWISPHELYAIVHTK
jgi:hypothetical protein